MIGNDASKNGPQKMNRDLIKRDAENLIEYAIK